MGAAKTRRGVFAEMSVTIQDHSAEVSAEIKAALLRGLEKCGLVAEGYAKKLCPVDTGNLRNSITHVVDEGGDAVYIGTNSEYGAYVIHKRNLAQESIIRVAGRILGYIKMQRDNFTLRMGNVPNHT
uniref:Putative tail component n=1 Tax=Podoviridae sp. ctyDR6 TaxID=2825288 RepID=A0A8S5QK97_9CAUD|nr:MAG TPA: putative tail component [Podoviridae sp. ctyDR6]